MTAAQRWLDSLGPAPSELVAYKRLDLAGRWEALEKSCAGASAEVRTAVYELGEFGAQILVEEETRQASRLAALPRETR